MVVCNLSRNKIIVGLNISRRSAGFMLTFAAIALSLLQVKNLEGTVASLQESRSHRGRITAPSEPGYYAQ